MSELDSMVASVVRKTLGKLPLRVQHKRMTKSQWERSSVILLEGEIGIETDTGFVKAGDGRSRFANLPYIAPASTSTGSTTSVSIQRTSVEYVSHTSGTQAPNSGWSTDIPTVQNGQYLWSRLTINYTNGSNTTMYSVARQGKDGEDGTGGGGTVNTGTSSPFVMFTAARNTTQSEIDGYTPNALKIFYVSGNTADFKEGDTVLIPINNTTNNTKGVVLVKATDRYSRDYLRGNIINYYGESVNAAGGTQNAVVRFEDLTPAQIQQLKGEKGDPGKQGVPGEKGDPGQNGTSVTAQRLTKSQYNGMSYKNPQTIYIITEV